MFKVGDTVRCIKQPSEECYQIEPGSIFEITSISFKRYIIRAAHLRSDPNECFLPKYFELVNSTPYGKSYPLGEAPQ